MLISKPNMAQPSISWHFLQDAPAPTGTELSAPEAASFAMVPEHSPSTAPFRISWPLPRPGLRSKPVPTPGTSRYFQSFTNTYAPISRLRELYTAAMAPEDVVVLSVATRPDCLPEETVNLLAELNRIKPVWVELGLQTIHPESAAWIRRGYDLPVFEQAVRQLRAVGISVIVHQILGLPGETPEQMVETARYIGKAVPPA